ncbi:MAG TPA: DUF5985 family protein [Gemmatimonadales bacterium]|nr:DUF5985 family protein [Gemmatimonadales bacterium]
MAYVVYVLCALTSVACAVLLLRGWREQRVKLLLWSGLCFAGFALGNLLLLVDVITGDASDMSLIRSLPVLGGLAILLYGLVVEA